MGQPIPTARQLEYQSWRFGLFLHFGVRTFYEGWKDFDERPMSPRQFEPSELDCDQWAKVAAEAGCRYAVMTAKHHDGFALWPSATTDFSVASSPWKDGKGDVVGEFVGACRRHGLAVGLYYSPFDAANPVYDDEKAYDDYFVTQLAEILEPYGAIDILWFDGCGSEGHEYDWPRIIGEIRRMQPNILLFNMGDPDFRWVGNEDGYAPLDVRNVVERIPFSINAVEGDRVEPTWLPAECDARVRERNWFYSDSDAHTVKSVSELVGMWYYSVGRGCNLLLNIGPDRRGLLPEPDAGALTGLGREIRSRFGDPLCSTEDVLQDGRRWSWTPESPTLVDHAILGEDVARGEHVERFSVVVSAPEPIVVYTGRTIGRQRICSFPAIRARDAWIEIGEARGDVSLSRVEFHFVGR